MNEWSGCCPPPGDAAASREPPAGDEALAELLLKLSVEMDIPSLRCAVSFQQGFAAGVARGAGCRRIPARRAHGGQSLGVDGAHLHLLELHHAERRVLTRWHGAAGGAADGRRRRLLALRDEARGVCGFLLPLRVAVLVENGGGAVSSLVAGVRQGVVGLGRQ